MQILLDTNALLWLLADDKRLGPKSRATAKEATLVVSEASLWEIAIKISTGKLQPVPELHDTVRDLGFRRLNIADEHLGVCQTLRFIHKDPFDRMLVSQALAEDIPLLTSDGFLKDYGVKILDARR